MGILYIVGVVQAFFIEFILLNKKKKTLPDKILAIWMFVIGLHLFLHYMIHVEFHRQYPAILGVAAPLAFFHGPFLLLYAQSLISQKQKFDKIKLLHFITPLSYYILLSPIFLLTTEEQIHFIFEQVPLNTPLYIEVYDRLIDVSGIVYITWSLTLLRKHQKRIGDNFSYTESVNLKWLRNLIIGMGIIWLAVIAANFLGETEGSNLVFGAVVLFIFLIGYKGTRQGLIFTDEFVAESENEGPSEKYQKSTLTPKMAKQYLKDLKQYMELEKPYLEKRLTLPQLASRLNINPNYLSQVINEQIDLKFQEFINTYRVREFKEKLRQNDHGRLTLLGIAYESGFNSKSSFNEAFKKIEGITPSEYLQQVELNT